MSADPIDPDRPDAPADGRLSSDAYAEASEVLGGRLAYDHALEKLIPKRWFRWILRRLTAESPRGTRLERLLHSYRNREAPLADRVTFWALHRLIDRVAGDTPAATVRRKLVEHAPTVRGLVVTARSLAEHGLTVPQRFSAPLFCVWNLTNKCNLRCRHCYQSSDHARLDGELSLAEKLDVVDQLGRMYTPMLALAGGEPTICPDLPAVLRRAKQYNMHTTIATNGVTLTRELAGELADAGLRYVEISLDSVDPATHDAFRGVPGMWEKAVAGMRNVVATDGLRLGVAMCVHRGNLAEVRDMIEFAIDIGAGAFAHFNFIPVGRGLEMVHGDLSPAEREGLLELLNEYLQSGRIGVISTAPQFGRVCLARAPLDDGLTSCSHAGSGPGVKARVVAKYLGGCGAGRTYICLEPTGEVTPCVYMPDRVMGHVRQTPIAEIFRSGAYSELLNDRDRRNHHCRVCAFKNYCGGCRARADAYFGRVEDGDPGCAFNDAHWERLVRDGVVAPADDSIPMAEMDITPTRHGPG